jgi:hypothetical protein
MRIATNGRRSQNNDRQRQHCDIGALGLYAQERSEMNLFFSCIFSHGDRIRERLADGSYALVCSECGDVKAIFPDQVLRVKKIKKSRRRKAQSADILTLTRKVG